MYAIIIELAATSIWANSRNTKKQDKTLRIRGFPGRARSFTLFSIQACLQAHCLNNRRTQLPRNSLCPQLVSLTANKSTNISAPVPGSGLKPDWCCGQFPTWLLSSQGLPHFATIISTLNLICFYSPSPLLSEDIPAFERVSLSHKRKGYALNVFRIMGTLKLWGKDFLFPQSFSTALQVWSETDSITIIWEFTRIANAWAPTGTYRVRIQWEEGPAIRFNKLSSWFRDLLKREKREASSCH